ncbi:MAG TPA: hypothetical protein PKZ41_06235, partial [Candidatus Omnitrophota bacterium]|nr:hypothetical protein [Candidatus Omnitrophota bacterium]
MFKCITEKIPERYLDGFREEQLKFIKSRLRLLCYLTISVYFALSILDFIFNRSEHMLLEMASGGVLVMAGVLTLFLDSRSKSSKATKITAMIFVTVLVLILVRIGITYYENPIVSSSGYVFSMLVVAMTIPWTPREVAPIGLIHLLGYIAENLHLYFMGKDIPEADFVSGLIFIVVSLTLCVVLRRKETQRDVDNFVLLKTVEEKNAQMKKDLELATRVHRTIIPDGIDTDLVNIKVTYLPAYYVGGDYARYVFLPGDKITFIISDVTGHGVPAALLVNRM